MSNPRIEQGSLNRLLASVVFAEFGYLNVTSPFLAKEAISIAFEGDTSQLIGTLTGAVTSPEPYIFATVTMHILRTQALGAAYKLQIENNTTMGSVNVYPDTKGFPPFQFDTCVLQSMQDIQLDGNQPGLIIKLRGVYRINASSFFGS
jgi:hypothetical protein